MLLLYIALILAGALLLRTERELFSNQLGSPSAFSAVANGNADAAAGVQEIFPASSLVQSSTSGFRSRRNPVISRAVGIPGTGTGNMPGNPSAGPDGVSGVTPLNDLASATSGDGTTPADTQTPDGNPTGGGGGAGVTIPLPSILPVPEPLTWVLWIVGFMAIGSIQRRRLRLKSASNERAARF